MNRQYFLIQNTTYFLSIPLSHLKLLSHFWINISDLNLSTILSFPPSMFKSHSRSTRSHRWNVKTFSFETREIERTTSCKKKKKNIHGISILSDRKRRNESWKKKKWRREIKMGGGGERRKREGRIEALRNVGLQRIDITS